MINFDVVSDFTQISDLNKLKNSFLYPNIIFDKPHRFKHYVEDMNFEKDTTSNTTIVHLKQFRNKRRKQIINEHLYFFAAGGKFDYVSQNSMKNYLNKKYDLQLGPELNLQKLLCLSDGFINLQSEYTAMQSANFDFTFKVDSTFLKPQRALTNF